MAIAERLAQVGEEIQHVENNLRECQRLLTAFWRHLRPANPREGSKSATDQRIRGLERRLQMLRNEQQSLIVRAIILAGSDIADSALRARMDLTSNRLSTRKAPQSCRMRALLALVPQSTLTRNTYQRSRFGTHCLFVRLFIPSPPSELRSSVDLNEVVPTNQVEPVHNPRVDKSSFSQSQGKDCCPRRKLCDQREKPNCIKEGTHAHWLEQSLLRIVSTRAHREAKVLALSRRAIAKLAEHYSFPLRDAHEKAVIVPATPEGSFPRTDDGKYRARRAAQRAAGTPH
ncbi:hypothetical protein Syun_031908 [Stephania yunnanensis]|uniref:Uncharacterized protein n=1 Tax=Stephania yunnanensis TaxID=152371 RepID=A0AAP0DWF1_9MAGN